jgi:hypothetical protein
MKTPLNDADYKRIEVMVNAETRALPPIDQTITITTRARALGAISSAGAIITLAIVEFVRSFGALALAIGFAWLEFTRVQHGGIALGMASNYAILTGLVVVMANVVHPIYVLRTHVSQSRVTVTRQTARGVLANWYTRIFAPAQLRDVDNTYNPTLSVSAFVLTITTIILAVYDVLSPLIKQLSGVVVLDANGLPIPARPDILLMAEFVMGLGLSIGGVLMLQAVSHELALRSLDFDVRSPEEILSSAKQARQTEIMAIRERIQAEYIIAKEAEMERKRQEKEAQKTVPLANTHTQTSLLGAWALGDHASGVTNGKPIVNGTDVSTEYRMMKKG